jgi:hypothetical protein
MLRLPVAEAGLSNAGVSLIFFSAGHTDDAHVKCP